MNKKHGNQDLRTKVGKKKDRMVGSNAEEVASWYFRLNGFFQIPGFVIHPDFKSHFPRTEADLIGVRFPLSQEIINGEPLEDDNWISKCENQIQFILVEVKTGLCDINGPWSNPEKENMQRVIRRLGFASDDKINNIATAMYNNLRYEDDTHILQYVAVGGKINQVLAGKYKGLMQITWETIGDFIFNRFDAFPEKLPEGPVNKSEIADVLCLWPGFGDYFVKKYVDGKITNGNDAYDAIDKYINLPRGK